ncbi:MAG: hypothetical protein DRN01_03045 [Thermoplasmata archaeon]|nr:MAG: hypothetical protein DRN01_03045 [Thermoplasmata archaeon]
MKATPYTYKIDESIREKVYDECGGLSLKSSVIIDNNRFYMRGVYLVNFMNACLFLLSVQG